MPSRLFQPLKEFGWPAGILYIADRLLRRLSPRLGLYVYEFMVQPIGGKPLLPPQFSKNLSVRQISRGDPEVAWMPARTEIKKARFDQGARCLGVYRKDQLIGYSWYCTDRYEEDEVRCTYELADKKSSIFDFDLYVLPEHRGGLGFLSVWHGVNETLAPAGVRHTFSRLTRFNLASRRAHAHLGWKRIGRAVFLEAWKLQGMLATLPPWVSLTWTDRQRVRLSLRPTVKPDANSATVQLESPE